MTSVKHNTEVYLERPRKFPAGLPVRLSVRCKDCSRRCMIDSYIPNGFPSAYAAKLGDVFSTLCAVQAEALPALDGQASLLSDASEV